MTRLRVVAALAAVVIAAGFGLAVRQTKDYDAAAAATNAHQYARAARLLDRAGRLNPDATVDLARARVAISEGDQGSTRRILLDVVRREPENAAAWGAIAYDFIQSDPALSKRGLQAFYRLNPKKPQP